MLSIFPCSCLLAVPEIKRLCVSLIKVELLGILLLIMYVFVLRKGYICRIDGFNNLIVYEDSTTCVSLYSLFHPSCTNFSVAISVAITAAGPVLPWIVTPVLGAIGPKIPGPDDFINTAKPGMALDEASRRTNIKYSHRSPPIMRGPVFAFF